jgi:hypothetical protein
LYEATIRDGQLVRFKAFVNRDQALEAVGLGCSRWIWARLVRASDLSHD